MNMMMMHALLTPNNTVIQGLTNVVLPARDSIEHLLRIPPDAVYSSIFIIIISSIFIRLCRNSSSITVPVSTPTITRYIKVLFVGVGIIQANIHRNKNKHLYLRFPIT